MGDIEEQTHTYTHAYIMHTEIKLYTEKFKLSNRGSNTPEQLLNARAGLIPKLKSCMGNMTISNINEQVAKNVSSLTIKG